MHARMYRISQWRCLEANTTSRRPPLGIYTNMCMQDQLVALPKVGPKRAESMLKGISAAAAGMPLGTLLYGLNIPHVGSRTGKDLARAFGGDLARLRDTTREELEAMPGGVGAQVELEAAQTGGGGALQWDGLARQYAHRLLPRGGRSLELQPHIVPLT